MRGLTEIQLMNEAALFCAKEKRPVRQATDPSLLREISEALYNSSLRSRPLTSIADLSSRAAETVDTLNRLSKVI